MTSQMKKPGTTLIVTLALLLVLLTIPIRSSGAQTLSARLRAGAAKVDITPSPNQLPIATDSIRDHLYVRAILVDSGSTCAALVNIDAGGARDNVVNDAIAKSSASTK